MTDEIKTPPGVVVLIVDTSNGYVLGKGADFEPQCFGLFTLEGSPERRAKKDAAASFVEQLCGPLVSAGMRADDCEALVKRLVQKGKVWVQVVPIGHDEEGE